MYHCTQVIHEKENYDHIRSAQTNSEESYYLGVHFSDHTISPTEVTPPPPVGGAYVLSFGSVGSQRRRGDVTMKTTLSDSADEIGRSLCQSPTT